MYKTKEKIQILKETNTILRKGGFSQMRKTKIISMLLIAISTLAIAGCSEGRLNTETPLVDSLSDMSEVFASETSVARTTAVTSKNTTTSVSRETTVADTKITKTKTTDSIAPPTEKSLIINSADYPLSLRSNPIYEVEVFFDDISPSFSGSEPAQSYEELARDLLLYNNSFNFVKYEITGIYSSEEVEKITKSDINGNSSTLYKARIVYDYLNQKETSIEINLARNGTATQQWRGQPLYNVGDVFVASLWDLDEYLSGGLTYVVADPELNFTIHEINGIKFAYYKNDRIKFINSDSKSLDVGVLNSEKSLVTTTHNNPVEYTQKLLVDELTEFIRNDWRQRNFKFLDLNRL